MRLKVFLPAAYGMVISLALAACAPSITPVPTATPSEVPIQIRANLTPTASPSRTPTEAAAPARILDGTYFIEGQAITLVSGLSEVEIAPGSASKSVTRYLGYDAAGDLNGDGKDDAAFLLTQDNGGSGTFYYVTAALRTDKAYEGTNAIFLGDRIAPWSARIEDGMVVVLFKDRKPDEAFAVEPSVVITKYLKVMDNNLVEVNPP